MAFPVGENALIKQFSRTYIPGNTHRPPTDGTPFRAAYCVEGYTEYTVNPLPQIATFVPNNTDEAQRSMAFSANPADYGKSFYSSANVTSSSIQPETTWKEVYGPSPDAQAGSPASDNVLIGWMKPISGVDISSQVEIRQRVMIGRETWVVGEDAASPSGKSLFREKRDPAFDGIPFDELPLDQQQVPTPIRLTGLSVSVNFIPGRVCYPEQPYVAPTPEVFPSASAISIDFQLGWNANARSIRSLLFDGRAEFKALKNIIGCVAGFSDRVDGVGYYYMTHSWYVSKGVAKILELGEEVYSHGAYADGDLFAVERVDSVVTYNVNGVTVYTSDEPSDGAVFLHASLYRADDYIYSPAIIDYDPGMEDVSPGGVAVYMLPCLSTSSDYVYGAVAASMEACQAFAFEENLSPNFGIVSVATAYCMSAAQETNLYSGADGITSNMLPCKSRSSADVEFVIVECLPCITDTYERTRIDVEFDNVISVLVSWYLTAEKIAIVSSDMSMAVVLAWDVFIESLLDSSVTITTGLSTIGDAALLIDTIIQLGFGVPVLSSDNHVWVVNEAGQTTRYEGYPFNSFCQIGGQYYGTREDGVYLLEGDTDAGIPIRASINLGKVDFGTTLMKHVPNCYIGVASDDHMYLKVISNGQEYIYSARSSSDQMQTQRFDIGKGLRSNFMIFELLNNDGCDFELGSIEFIAIPSISRRI